MHPDTSLPSFHAVPEIVHTTLYEMAQLRCTARWSEADAESKVKQLVSEELEPRGLTLLRRDLADGRLRFLVKARENGAVCDLVESAR